MGHLQYLITASEDLRLTRVIFHLWNGLQLEGGAWQRGPHSTRHLLQPAKLKSHQIFIPEDTNLTCLTNQETCAEGHVHEDMQETLLQEITMSVSRI
jgi:hypothetical protein